MSKADGSETNGTPLAPTEPVTQRMAAGRVSLKLLVDKRKRTVLFAEAGKDFVDFLFHILTLPVGQVIQLLTSAGMVGSLGNLYGSVEKMNDVFIESFKKDILLRSKSPAFLSGIPFLLPETSSLDSAPYTYYRCSSRLHSNCWHYVAEDRSAICPQCKNPMNQTFTLVKKSAGKPTYYGCSLRPHACCRNYMSKEPAAICPQCTNSMNQKFSFIKSPSANAASAAEWDGKGGFVLGEVMYMVMDDLAVKPITSSITLLTKFNAEEIGNLEEKVVSLGMDEGIELLKTSLHSQKVLTDVFLGVKRERS